jgi:hypothetical protein
VRRIKIIESLFLGYHLVRSVESGSFDYIHRFKSYLNNVSRYLYLYLYLLSVDTMLVMIYFININLFI